jgi:hypothetical protein
MSNSGVIRAKHWFFLASEQLSSRHPLAAGVAVSLLQDSVESLAHSAAGNVNASLPARASFVDYWDKLPGPKKLPYRTEMTALNNARVSYKHHGVLPATNEAERLAVLAHQFLVETTQLFFSVDFDRVTEVDLIANQKCRAFVVSAETELASGNINVALNRCLDAMDEVKNDLAERVPPVKRQPFPPRTILGDDSYKWLKTELDEYSLAISLISVGVLPYEYRLASMMLPTASFNRAKYWHQGPEPSPSNVAETIRVITRIALRVQSAADNLDRISREIER